MVASIVVISGEQRSTRSILGALRHAGYAVTGPTDVNPLSGAPDATRTVLVCLVETEPVATPTRARASPALSPASGVSGLRPSGPAPAAGETIEIGHLGINLARSELRVAGRPVKLRAKEFGLLVALAWAAGGILTRRELLERVWGDPCPSTSRTVDVHITWLRAKLVGGAVRIEGVRGCGYRLLPVPDALAS